MTIINFIKYCCMVYCWSGSGNHCRKRSKRFYKYVLLVVSLLLFFLVDLTYSESSSSSLRLNGENTSFEACSEMPIWPSTTSNDGRDDYDRLEKDVEVDENNMTGGNEDENYGIEKIMTDHEDNQTEQEERNLLKQIYAKKKQELENRRKLQIIINQQLGKIDNLSQGIVGELCTSPSKHTHIFQNVPIGTHIYKIPQDKADLIAYFMTNSIPSSTTVRKPPNGSKLPQTQFKDPKKLETNFHTLFQEPQIQHLRFVEYFIQAKSNHTLYERVNYNGQFIGIPITLDKLNNYLWFFDPHEKYKTNELKYSHQHFMRSNETLRSQLFVGEIQTNTTTNKNMNEKVNPNMNGQWSWPYFQCIDDWIHGNQNNDQKLNRKWFISYSVAFPLSSNTNGEPFSFGLLSFDIDLTSKSINQCGFSSEVERELDFNNNPLFAFRETNKCDPETTECHFLQLSPHNGWRKGNYECRCKANHYAINPGWNNTISGFKAESTWCKEIIVPSEILNNQKDVNITNNNNNERLFTFKDIVSCSPCPPECPDCFDGKSCMAETNLVFRIILLCISIICSIGTFGLIITVYKLRRLPLLRNSSPIFVCITLIGCIIMYSEMVALFPMLTLASCIAVKWTRHLGFCVTYTALYMKLCRVYLTYRVKSAHKIKLTEKHLLHWMSPIMVIMLLYLFAWTLSDPPSITFLHNWYGKKFTQCVYNWWDHSLAIGEFIFLMYGVWICWRIRENPEAQFISYSIYNIAVVNTLMVSLHLLIVPKAGPDLKYLFAFIRTQLSTTVTIALVLGNRLYHIIRGDAASKREIANSANGFGHESLDLAEENQQLKEELHKMATQMERLKSYAMCKNNPHLKHNPGLPNDKDFGRLDSFTAL